jgi:hypothetical protein
MNVALMTVLLSIAVERGIRKEDYLSFIVMVLVYLQTLVFLLVFSTGYYLVSIAIAVILFVVPIGLRNLGLSKASYVAFLLSNELLMSLLYYVMLRGLGNAVEALYFYGTDLPTFSFSPLQVLVDLVELANSFMFFLMIIPEVLYFSYKTKNYFPAILSALALSGPNVASEMTHSILPLPYDPVKEASILVAVLSFGLAIYLTYTTLKGKRDFYDLLAFSAFDVALGACCLYYSLSINEVPYGLVTLLAIFFSFYDLDLKLKLKKRLLYVSESLLVISQMLWGASIALFYNQVALVYLISFSTALVYLASHHYVTRVFSQRLQ